MASEMQLVGAGLAAIGYWCGGDWRWHYFW